MAKPELVAAADPVVAEGAVARVPELEDQAPAALRQVQVGEKPEPLGSGLLHQRSCVAEAPAPPVALLLGRVAGVEREADSASRRRMSARCSGFLLNSGSQGKIPMSGWMYRPFSRG